MLVTPYNFDACLARVRENRVLVWDLETDGLRPYKGSRLFGVAVQAGVEGEAMYFPFRHRGGLGNLHEAALPPLLRTLTDTDHTLVGFNSIRFDGPMLAAEAPWLAERMLYPGGPRQRDVILDALLANENEPSFSLDSLGQKYLDSAGKAEAQERLLAQVRQLYPRLRAKRQLMGHLAELPPHVVEPYACQDVRDTAALAKLYDSHLEAWGLTALAEEMYDFARLLGRIERRGLAIDAELCQRRERECLEEQERVLRRIQSAAPHGFNPASPAQVARLLGTEDAEAETLRRTGHPLALEVILFKQLGKMAKTYYRAMLEGMDEHGIIHPQMNVSRDPRDQGGTRSGRLSCSNPNFQNLPKRSKLGFMQIRDCVVARPGHKLIALDYERAEMWLGGHYSRDESLFEAYHAGRDLYQELADVTLGSRDEGKRDWFSIQYGAGPGKIAEKNGWPFEALDEIAAATGKPVEEWKDPEWRRYKDQTSVQVRDGFFDLCPGIKHKMQELREVAENVGSIRLWTGRAIHFDGRRTRPFTAWNRLIQGGVGEIVRRSMQKMEEPLSVLGAEMVLQVHDEVVIEAPESAAREAARVAKHVMEDFDFWLRPRVDISWGDRFGALKEMDI